MFKFLDTCTTLSTELFACSAHISPARGSSLGTSDSGGTIGFSHIFCNELSNVLRFLSNNYRKDIVRLFYLHRASHVKVLQTGGMVDAAKYLVGWDEAFIYVILRKTIPRGERQRSRERQRICLVPKTLSRGKRPRLENAVLCMQGLGFRVLIQQPSPPSALLCESNSTGKRAVTGIEVCEEGAAGGLAIEH